MSDNSASPQPAPLGDVHALVIPAFGKSPALPLDMGKIREAQRRTTEAQHVSPVTYAELEHCFNEGYRDLKRHLSSIGFQITQAQKAMEIAKADVILDKYPAYLEGKPKSTDNADRRNAFLARDVEFQAALDRFNQLKAIESNFDGKIKELENVCRYMRKKMDLLIRSGVPTNYHSTQK